MFGYAIPVDVELVAGRAGNTVKVVTRSTIAGTNTVDER